MRFEVQFFGATGEVTGSLYVIRAGSHTVLLECGLVQGNSEEEERNREDFPVPVDEIDAVILSHAHIDHSGRVPRLVKEGYGGRILVHEATLALCAIMLPDAGYLNEKDAERENRHRGRRDQGPVQPLYTLEEARQCLDQFDGFAYGEVIDVVPGLTLTFHDAGHILGSTIVELRYTEEGVTRTLVFSGDLGYRDSPLLDDPVRLEHADTVMLESTYGDRLHRPFADTIDELTDVFERARAAQGNILIPAFTVGRTQDLLFLMAENHERWRLDKWHIFVDSPMAIEATGVYARYRELYGEDLFGRGTSVPELPRLHMTRTAAESMQINNIEAGAIVIAGSGMCSGGRILHHLKHNIWRPECHVIIVGFQAYGTLGRRLVDGAETIKLWGDEYAVRASIHTIGGLSAHGDQDDLVAWYGAFTNRPPVYLVHGENAAQEVLARRLRQELGAEVGIAERGQRVRIGGQSP